jgi:predicted aldo/keto reductase-like oxidoreductase
MERTAALAPGLPEVCRMGLATRGNTHLKIDDVEWAVERGINYLNWCGHPDSLSRAVARMGSKRNGVVIATQFEARSAKDAERELESVLKELRTDYIDVLTLYYVEAQNEWEEIISPGGAWNYLDEQKRRGRLKLIGLTSHQRPLAAEWAQSGKLDLLMIRYNAAHRGAEQDVFPVTQAWRIPVVSFTGQRWKALSHRTSEDPEGFAPPQAVEWYRFCLANPDVAVALAAPNNRAELEQDVSLLDDWHAPEPEQLATLRAHGDRVKRTAGMFW